MGRYPHWELQGQTANYRKFVKNIKNNPRFPRLDFYERKDNREPYIKIEFSATKVLFGNSLDEIEEKQFPSLIDTLKERLIEMGEIVSKEDLINADVRSFHPSKNFPLSDGYTADGIRKELSKININKKFDLTGMIFKNDGRSLQIYTKAHSLVFYDKIADLNRKKNKAIDKDQTTQQLSLFEEIKEKQPKLEVLRMEVRLSEKQKMSSILQKLGFQKNPKFRDIFKRDVCQKIVRYYWDTIIRGENLFLFELSNDPFTLLDNILLNNQNISFNKALKLVSLSTLCKYGGARELRDRAEKKITRRNWYILSNDIKSLNKISEGKPLHSWVKYIEDTIDNFSPYKTDRDQIRI